MLNILKNITKHLALGLCMLLAGNASLDAIGRNGKGSFNSSVKHKKHKRRVPAPAKATKAPTVAPAVARLVEATKRNDLEAVKQLVAAGADVNQRDQFGNTALMWTCSQGLLPIASFLINAGADVSLALDKAISGGHLPLVRLLLTAGVDFDPLVAFSDAMYHGSTHIARFLVRAGLCADKKDDALYCAASYGNIDLVRELLAAGANIGSSTAYQQAYANGYHEIADILLEHMEQQCGGVEAAQHKIMEQDLIYVKANRYISVRSLPVLTRYIQKVLGSVEFSK